MHLNILVVDDSPDDIEFIKRSLRKSGFDISVLEAETAEGGLAIIRGCKKPIDCAFIDYRLPDMDGISFLKSVYDKESGLGPCPMVMMTGQGSEAVAADAICNGAQDYIMKENISTDTLHTAIVKAQQVFELKQSHNKTKVILEHSQKMEAIGKLTGGIAHDFNNILTIIFGNTRQATDLLKKDTPDIERSIQKIEAIQQASQRGADLVQRLMAFAKHRRLDPTTVNVNKAVTDIQNILRRTLGDDVEVRTCLAEDCYHANIDLGQFEHAMINMGLNARDAIEESGTITLTTENITLEESHVETLGLPPGEYVKLGVSDTGSGVPEDIQDKVFEPFFTTKGVGRGTGLGLSLVYDFVTGSNGAIRIESNDGVGSVFNIYLPKSDVTIDTLPGDVDVTEDRRGNEKILIVEDEDQIREVVSNILREAGYTVLTAVNGEDAIRIIQNKSNDIDLMFIDVALPGGMNGIQVADYVHLIQPEMNFLFTSGYYKSIEPEKVETLKNYDILYKPYKPEVLMHKIRQIIES